MYCVCQPGLCKHIVYTLGIIEYVHMPQCTCKSVFFATVCDVIAQRVVQITNDEETILWERYGLRLHIPSNALPDNVSQLQLKIEVSASGNFELREDSILVSAVYSFSHDLGDRNLRRPVTLQIQHCATIAAIGKLNFIRADKTFDASAPCKFHIVEGGVFFNRSDGYGEIKLHRFCSIGIQLWWYRHVVSWFYTLKPCAALYYTNINVGRQIFQFHLYVFPWLNAVKEVCHCLCDEHTN